MSDSLIHQCANCGHEWKSINLATAKAVHVAVKTNKTGPWCEMCRNFEMAARFADFRNLTPRQAMAVWAKGKESYRP